MKNYLGCYYLFKTKTKIDAREYILTISEASEEKIQFSLELIMSGNFGSAGIIWKGDCLFNGNNVTLECKEKVDWNYTFLDEEKQNQIRKFCKNFYGTFSKEGKNLRLDLSLDLKRIFLYKIDLDEKNLSFWIFRKIIEERNLEAKVKEYDPHRFWCISNLVFKNISETENIGLEFLCEYDVEYRLEEKRVINADEIVSTHHTDKALFDSQQKLIKYKYLE